MASDVSIANGALSLLGVEPIIALTDDSEPARQMTRIYQPTVDEVLRSHRWNCATFRQALALLSAAPAFDYSYQFALPTDPYCLRVLETDLEPDEAWRVENYISGSTSVRVIVTDASALNIVFIGRITDPNFFDALLRSALEFRLAAKSAVALKGKASQGVELMKMYDAEIKRAKSVDGQEMSFVKAETTALTDVR